VSFVKSEHQAATHILFMDSVKIRDGAELLGIGGERDAYHANNLLRCYDEPWYFIELQAALWHFHPSNLMASALGRFAPLKKVVTTCSRSQESPLGWICPLATPIQNCELELLQAKF